MLQANVFLKDFQKKYSYSMFDNRKSNCPPPSRRAAYSKLDMPAGQEKSAGKPDIRFPRTLPGRSL
jgi:hypothetical protein